jgi:hypothetical protein
LSGCVCQVTCALCRCNCLCCTAQVVLF